MLLGNMECGNDREDVLWGEIVVFIFSESR